MTSTQQRSPDQGMPGTVVDSILAHLESFAPTIVSRAGPAEAARRLPAEVFEIFKSVGIFRMTAPEAYGGLELDFPTVARVLQALARLDGSVGWMGTLAAASTTLLPLFPRQTYEEIYRNGPDVRFAGVSQVAGTAVAEAGGFRVNGRWPFASGCEDADWIAGFCGLTEDVTTASEAAVGSPAIVVVCMPARYWQIEDTWQAPGLRATGSHHVVLKDAFVPAANVCDLSVAKSFVPGPLYSAPMQIVTLAHGPIALGLAQGALDDIISIARGGRKQQRAASSMRDSEIFQFELGRAQADFHAAESLFAAQTASHWRHALAGTLAGDHLSVKATQSMVWVTEACLRVVQTCFSLAGGAAVSVSPPLHRRLRDMQTVALHAVVQQRHYAESGKHLLNQD